jgi:PhoH-like ATPase
MDALTNQDVPLVTITGKAGTGKTLLALAAALEKRRCFRQIFISRPSVPLSNKDIGFLPGDIQSKLDPYMQPLYDNLSVIESNQNGKSGNGHGRRVKELLDEEKIVITPLSYIRGRSIVKVFFIVDEAQNLTPHEVKTIITRAGEGTKIVLTGDIYQIDHPYLDSQSNGLSYLIEKMKGQQLYTHINLEKGERSELSDLAISLL